MRPSSRHNAGFTAFSTIGVVLAKWFVPPVPRLLVPHHVSPSAFRVPKPFRGTGFRHFPCHLAEIRHHWIKAKLFALVNRNRYHPASPNHPLLINNPHDLSIFMEYVVNLYSKKKVPDFFWSTPQRIFSPYVLLPDSDKESSCKVIYLCWNPKDVFVSSWLFANKLREKWSSLDSLDKAFDKFFRGLSLGGPSWDNVLGHWKESLANPGKVMFLKYEDLKQCPGMVVRNVAEFLGCPISTDEESKGIVDDIIELCSLEKLRSLEVNGSTKKISMIDIEMVARIDRITDGK